jgi:hypothetical protein
VFWYSPKKDEVTGGRNIAEDCVVLNIFEMIKEKRIARYVERMEKIKIKFTSSVTKPRRKILFRSHRRRWQNNIRMDFEGIRSEGRVDSPGSENRSVTGPFNDCNENSDSMKGGKFVG